MIVSNPFTQCIISGLPASSASVACALNTSCCNSSFAGDFNLSVPHSPMTHTFSLHAFALIIANCFSQSLLIFHGCMPMDILLPVMYSLLFSIEDWLSHSLLWVCMSRSSILCLFMVQGRSLNRPRDGNAECVLLQGIVL